MPTIGAVAVLYRLPESESPAIQALEGISRPSRRSLYVVTHDNTETPQPEGSQSPTVDRRTADPTNPGLASAYTQALEAVEAAGCSWMILLDQDTRVTDAYLSEVLALVDRDELASARVDILVPVLQHAGRQVSPHARPRLRSRAAHVTPHTALSGSTWYYNSGLVLRTAAVRHAGGFPLEYPLDYLDHALAQRMRVQGSVAWQLASTLEHDLSVLDPASMSPSRYRSIANAEERFAAEYGTPSDRLWLVARRAVLAAMAVLRLKPSPSRSAEARAVLNATLTAAGRETPR